jgi:hypothetical protein
MKKNAIFSFVFLVLALQQIKANFAQGCITPKSTTELKINNLRTKLSNGGDFWWNINGAAQALQVKAGTSPIATIFASGLWAGGIDAGGNLKMACSTYRNKGNDWFPGPLNPTTSTTTSDDCTNWDRHFEVFGDEIRAFQKAFNDAPKDTNGNVIDKAALLKVIPKNILGYPAIGNPHFKSIHGFDLLPKTDYFAYFWDNNFDGTYDPTNGDLPTFNRIIDDCPDLPDQMVFWIFNDEGNGATHSLSKGKSMGLEVQATTAAYQSDNSYLQNAVFQHFRVINRNTETIDSTFFGLWIDPQLGCGDDDYLGFNAGKTSTYKQSMLYFYNADNSDAGANCTGFGNEIPMLGIDIIRKPVYVNGTLVKEAPLSFMYYINKDYESQYSPAMTDPESALDYYRYLNCVWKDGTPLTRGGNGYNPTDPTAKETKISFADAPNDKKGWSLQNQNLVAADFRALLSMGPIPLRAGAINEIFYTTLALPNQGGGAVKIQNLSKAMVELREAFNDVWCKNAPINIGPDAPSIKSIEMDNAVLLQLENMNNWSNNFKQKYDDLKEIPFDYYFDENYPNIEQFYQFEGYKIYQLKDYYSISNELFADSTKAKLVAQSDFKNTSATMYNWDFKFDTVNVAALKYEKKLQVEGENKGLNTLYLFNKDAFTNKPFENGKSYYFAAVAYAQNNFKNYDPNTGEGQRFPYLQSRNSTIYVIEVKPKKPFPSGSQFGDEPEITRLDGVGVGSRFIDIKEEMYDKMLQSNYDKTITYQKGKAPIKVKIVDPQKLQEGDYELTFEDGNMNDLELDANAVWKLKKLGDPDVVISNKSIAKLQEQYIDKYGLSVAIGQTKDAGQDTLSSNYGAIGGTITYKDANQPKWFSGVVNQDSIFHFILNNKGEELYNFDPKQQFSKNFVNGQWYPYSICNYKPISTQATIQAYASPSWHNSKNGSFYISNIKYLGRLNNVDIIFTSDKSKWSRCMVVETNNTMYQNDGLLPKGFNTQVELNNANFALRRDTSIGSDTHPDDLTDGTIGKSWFPGYAVDVETGERLTIFFGENSAYDEKNTPGIDTFLQFIHELTGGDMIFNPTADLIVPHINGGTTALLPSNFCMGGGHYIYITNEPYQNWKKIYDGLIQNPTAQQNFIKSITWTTMPYLKDSIQLKSYKDGIVPNDCTIKLRVDNPYQVKAGFGTNNAHPSYRFSIHKNMINSKDVRLKNTDNQDVTIFPNPANSLVTIRSEAAINEILIFSTDGKLLRKIKVNNEKSMQWDLANANGNRVGQGVYFLAIRTNLGWVSKKIVIME